MTNKEFVAEVKAHCLNSKNLAIQKCTVQTVPQAVLVSVFYFNKEVYTKIEGRPNSKWLIRKS